VKANDKARLYGDANPALDGVITGIKNSDNITATYSTAATPASAVGTYNIVPTLVDPDGKLGNYTATSTNGTLTITKAPLTVTADDQTRIYGDANPAFTVTYSGFKNGENQAVVSGSPSCSTLATPSTAVGTAAITCSLGTLAATNYSFSFVGGTLTITKATLTVKANDKARLYGDANPALDGVITGIKNSDNITATYS